MRRSVKSASFAAKESIEAALTARPDGRFAVALKGGRTVVLDPAGADTPRVSTWPGHVTVFEGAEAQSFAVPDPEAEAEAGAGDNLRAPMPGLVKIVRAATGEHVAKGQALLVLEAMKMEHTITAPHEGIVAEIAAQGAQVSDGTVLVRFEEEAGA